MAKDEELEDEDMGEGESSPDSADDVSLAPGFNADSWEDVERYVREEVRALFDVYSYRHAASILANSFPQEFAEIQDALMQFRMTVRDIGLPGGNESVMPKKFSRVLRPREWFEARIQADLT